MGVDPRSTVRTLEAVAWIAEYLDDPNLDQSACRAIVSLPTIGSCATRTWTVFAVLDKVSRISKDPEVIERAKKYRLGL